MFSKFFSNKLRSKVCFADGWDKFFENHGMSSFEDFFARFDPAHDGKETWSKKSKSDVQIFKLPDENQDTVFFLKRFRNANTKTTTRAFMQRGRIISRGKLECSNARLLIENGIGAYEPVCFGEKSIFGFETDSFVVTKKLDMQCLEDFVAQKWKSLSLQEQKKLITELVKTIRKAHSLNVSIRDLYIKHIFINEDNDKFSFSFIDLENLWQNVFDPFTKARDLGRLYFSMDDSNFSKQMKELLVETYLANAPTWQKPLMRHLILSRAKKRKKRHSEKMKFAEKLKEKV